MKSAGDQIPPKEGTHQHVLSAGSYNHTTTGPPGKSCLRNLSGTVGPTKRLGSSVFIMVVELFCKTIQSCGPDCLGSRVPHIPSIMNYTWYTPPPNTMLPQFPRLCSFFWIFSSPSQLLQYFIKISSYSWHRDQVTPCRFDTNDTELANCNIFPYRYLSTSMALQVPVIWRYVITIRRDKTWTIEPFREGCTTNSGSYDTVSDSYQVRTTVSLVQHKLSDLRKFR